MNKFIKKFFRKLYCLTLRNKLIIPIIELRPQNVLAYFGYLSDLRKYRHQSKESLDLWPILGEKTKTTGIDPHYFYQGVWAFEKILKSNTPEHVDVASQASWVGLLSRITKVKFVDIRPIVTNLENLESIEGNILQLPFQDNSIQSLSCLHVAEHIGLGRYGDPLDPRGTEKACQELARVLAPGGNLYFSLPIGKERTEFNAHRVHNPKTILKYFNNLRLVEFSAVTDRGEFIQDANIDNFANAKYSCGLFHFTKP